MIRRFAFFTLALCLFGCGKPTQPLPVAVKSSTADGFSMGNLAEAEVEKMKRKGYRPNPTQVLAVFPRPSFLRVPQFSKQGYSIVVAPLRNPGTVFVFQARGGYPLKPEDRAHIQLMAVELGGTMVDGAIPYHYGPDGKTQIIMRKGERYGGGSGAALVDFRVSFTFSRTKDALVAVKYIDASDYILTPAGPNLEVLVRIPEDEVAEEKGLFQALARQLGGKVSFTSKPTQPKNSLRGPSSAL
ncbi:MAG: hypothetical protein ABL962_08065 [Fimbriimonadaceae bacterium]